MIEPLCEELIYLEHLTSYFQQDNATVHSANESMREMHHIFAYRIISKELWPAHSPDLTPCDFNFWGTMKCRVYATNPEELIENF